MWVNNRIFLHDIVRRRLSTSPKYWLVERIVQPRFIRFANLLKLTFNILLGIESQRFLDHLPDVVRAIILQSQISILPLLRITAKIINVTTNAALEQLVD